MDSNDSEISECLNLLRPSFRRDYKTNRTGYFNNQQHSVNFLSEWRKPKKRKTHNRLRRGLESSTSLILQKKNSTEKIFDSTGGVVSSYTCLPNICGQKLIQHQETANSYPQQPNNRVVKPVIQVIVIPNEEGETQLQKHKLSKIANDHSKNLNAIETNNVYLVVVGPNKDKVYEIKTTDTTAIAEEVSEEDVGHVFNGVDRFKQIIKSITMEKKKHHIVGNKHETVQYMNLSKEHACKCCQDSPPSTLPLSKPPPSNTPPVKPPPSKPLPSKFPLGRPSPCQLLPCYPQPCTPPPCTPPPCTIPLCYLPPPCPPCPPCPRTRSQERPLPIGVGKNKVTIHGQLGIDEEDRFVMKCAATVDDKPVIPEFSHVGLRASRHRETADKRNDLNENNDPGTTITIIRPRAIDKVTQCACRFSANEFNTSELSDSQSPVFVISVMPKDQDGIDELTNRKPHVLNDSCRPCAPAINRYNDDDDYDEDDYIARPYSQRVDHFTQDGHVLNRNYNDGQAQTLRPGRPQATYVTDGLENTPRGRPRSYDFNDEDRRIKSRPTAYNCNQDYIGEERVTQDVASQVMGLKNFNGGQIWMTHSSIHEPRITKSNYTQNYEDILGRNMNNNRRENMHTRNTSTQDGPAQHKKQRRGINRSGAGTISFSPNRYDQIDRDDEMWASNTGNPRTCVNKTYTEEGLDDMIRDDGYVGKKWGNRNRNVNNKIYRGPTRSTSPPKHKRNLIESHIVETSLVKTKRSKSPIPTKIPNKEPKKNVSQKQKATTAAMTSRSALNAKSPASKPRDKMNNSNQLKSKTFGADNYKKIVNDRVDEYNRLSPKHDVSKISVNIDSENEYYDVSFHQGLNVTDLSIRKTLKDNRKTGSLQNLFCKPNTLCVVKNKTDFENRLLESNSRFHVRDSLEISHRHSQKTETAPLIKKADKNFSVSNDNLVNYAPIKHFTGDNCTIRDPIERDKEIRELLGIPRRIISSQQNDSQRHNLFEDRSFITQPFINDPKRKTVTLNYSSLCSCCCGRPAGRHPVEPVVGRQPKPKKHKKIRKKKQHICGCYPEENSDKKNIASTNLYQQLILNRNIQVFLQVDQFCKQKPICLSKKQYDKVKKTIKSTLSKNKHLQAVEKKPKQSGIKDKSSPQSPGTKEKFRSLKPDENKEKYCCTNVDCIGNAKESPLEKKPSIGKKLTRVLEKTSLEDKSTSPEIIPSQVEIIPLEGKRSFEVEKKESPKKTTDQCCQNTHPYFKNANVETDTTRCGIVGCSSAEHHVCCHCNKKSMVKYMPFDKTEKEPLEPLGKKLKHTKPKKKKLSCQCPCVHSLISIGQVRLKPREEQTNNNSLNEQDPHFEENLKGIDVEYDREIVEDANFDLDDVVDDNEDDCLDPCMTPCQRAWLEYKRFRTQDVKEGHIDTVILYKRDVKPQDHDARKTMSSMEVRYATNVAYIKQLAFSSMDVFDSLLSDSSLALKDPVSIETLFKGHTKSPTPNLGTSTMSSLSEPSGRETPLCQEKPAKRPFLKRLMSCLVLRSERTPGPNLKPPKYRTPTMESSFDSYHISTSLGAIDMTSSLYDTSASFYTNHSVLPQNIKLSKRGFLSSVREFLYNRKS